MYTMYTMQQKKSSIISHADESWVSIVTVSTCVCQLICPHDKTKTAESTITKLATAILQSINI